MILLFSRRVRRSPAAEKLSNYPEATKPSISCSAGKLKARELNEEVVDEENRWWEERYVNREGNPDPDAGLSDKDFQPKKRHKFRLQQVGLFLIIIIFSFLFFSFLC